MTRITIGSLPNVDIFIADVQAQLPRFVRHSTLTKVPLDTDFREVRSMVLSPGRLQQIDGEDLIEAYHTCDYAEVPHLSCTLDNGL